MSAGVVRRKRGRPRADEPREINDFDLALVQEFQRRPAFYDRTHPQYRNREHLEPQWQEMANALGYNVALVKNRLLQLRNRYNLEKRRVEALQEQYNDPDITSQWSLYQSLSFLGDHIKSRRSFINLKPNVKQAVSNSSDADDGEDSRQYQNGNLQHKSTGLTFPQPIIKQNQSFECEPDNQSMMRRNSVELARKRHSDDGSEKFKAFGQFLASSLIELNEKDALCLVEKFTSDLVHSLLSEQEPKQQTSSDTDMELSI